MFYEKGIANVRLQQIADKTTIRVSNLHYKTNETVVKAGYEEVFYRLTQMLKDSLKQTSLSDFNAFLRHESLTLKF